MSFARAICKAMEKIAPLRLAEPWDNVGLLLEVPPINPATKKVLLTIDLTPSVAQEAISNQASLIIAYHPTIFKPLRSLTLTDPLQASLVRLTQAGISVYSPHTALDSVTGGINDWLVQAFTPDHPTVSYIENKNDEAGGGGRLVTLPSPGISIADAVLRVKNHLEIKQVQLATPIEGARNISTIAICAGSGGSMFKDVSADLYFTGEMSHHEVLAARAMNRYVILCGHTNTERGYLRTLKEKLIQEKSDEALTGLEIIISNQDKHPLQIV
ncbi:NGG1p interacting factor 3 [Pyrrhoderma noxium]|uniref:NGG1p interacting factor 3 n=1 Tax=Pyrrhoderma noxium TaxID=2282107 RepID=A0A286UTK1_9AGAM|nr:NGG1p interacting factor 3 [Pyrrhoderma noxium]